jgi:hypothetical protein
MTFILPRPGFDVECHALALDLTSRLSGQDRAGECRHLGGLEYDLYSSPSGHPFNTHTPPSHGCFGHINRGA